MASKKKTKKKTREEKETLPTGGKITASLSAKLPPAAWGAMAGGATSVITQVVFFR